MKLLNFEESLLKCHRLLKKYNKRWVYKMHKFPQVIGVIDCTHIRIQSPCRDIGEQYRNRKGYFSFNVQATCNSNLEITDIVAR